jgi:hypothetical protein
MWSKGKVLQANPSRVSVEKELPIGKFQPSSENKKRLVGNSKIGCGLSLTAEIKETAFFNNRLSASGKYGPESVHS